MPTKADWFLVITFVEEASLHWGNRINKEAEGVQINSKHMGCLQGPTVATAAQQEVPKSPKERRL